MSKLNVYVIRDVRAEAYLRPFFLQNDSVLERSVLEGMKDENSFFCSNPEDYAVYRLGVYDDSVGKLDVHEPIHMYNLVDLKVVDHG